MRKISVGEIEKLLFYITNDLRGYRVGDRVLQEGQWVHNRLGYNQQEIYRRFFYYKEDGNEEIWQVGGCPDKIDYNEGVIRELKTYRSPKAKEFLLEVGKSQANIYCWLTGLKRYCVDLYNVSEQKITDSVCEEFNEQKAMQDISEAIKRKKYLYELSETWKVRK